jgi:two-component system, probable response regulator PhcQ
MHQILIVDDEQSVLNSLKRALGREGYKITALTNSAKALETAMIQAYDLVMSDYRMPEMDGLAFLKLMKERQPDALRVILTAHADVSTVMEAINKCEVYRFLSKPWNDDELKLTIRQALAHRDLLIENGRLSEENRQQRQTIEMLEKQYPGISYVKRAEDGAIVVDN